MKTLIFACFIILLISTKCLFAQEIRYNSDGSVDLHFVSVDKWEAFKKQSIELYIDNLSKDSLINEVLLPGIERLNRIVAQKDTTLKYRDAFIWKSEEQISILKNALIDSYNQMNPDFLYFGTYVYMKSGYLFNDDNASKKFMSNIADNLSFGLITSIRYKKILISPNININVNNGIAPGIFIKAGYLIF